MYFSKRLAGFAVSLLFGVIPCRLFGQSMPQNFYSAAPCRIVDTRTSQGGAGPISGGTTRDFKVAGVCSIPTTATAFSLNITVVPPGSLLFLTLYPAGTSRPLASTLNDPLGTIIANAAIVPSGSGGAVTVYVSDTSDVIIDVDGYFIDQTTPLSFNTALGTGALGGNSTGPENTAVGYQSLTNNTSGSNNIAMGFESLSANSIGAFNTGVGDRTLLNNTSGSSNTAVGSVALEANSSGNNNVGVGMSAAGLNTTGQNNTAVGFEALYQNNTGSNNIVIGYQAGYNTLGSNNIDIGNIGGGSNAIRIGTDGTQTATYIAGINGAPVTGSAVLISSNGQLGVQSSSIRYKEDVQAIADSDDPLMRLRPVQFRYKQPAADGTNPLQYGLIAEEVAEIFPQLVVRGADGRVDSVQYHELPVLLLDKLQKQEKVIEELQREIEGLQKR